MTPRRRLVGPLRRGAARAIACIGLGFAPLPLEAQPVDLAEMLALCQDQTGNIEKRIAACTLVVDADTIAQDMRIEALMNRGTALEVREDPEAARADYTLVIALDPGNALAYYNRGNVHARQDQPEQALADYDKAISLDGNDGDFFTNRGLIHTELGHFEKAVADFDRAIELGLNEAAIWSARGLANERLGRTQDATSDYRKALVLDSQDADALEGLERLASR
jgi:tetratricopeptide (TPR) repeat protein